jgi:hypothetical protein
MRESSARTVVACVTCRHYNLRSRPQLFEGAELQAPGVLKAQTQWDQDQRQQAQGEMQRFHAHQPFTYEPQHYAWCAWYSEIALVQRAQAGDESAWEQLVSSGGAIINPVSGQLSPLYVLCAWKNTDGHCEHHEVRDD